MLAIVIPYYKKAFFKETLLSLANQTDQRFRVYIGNDNSPENPDDLILEFSKKLELVYENFTVNLGQKSLVKHWERCINLANDEAWITILGDDDVYEANVVEEFYNNIKDVEENGINVIRFSTLKIDDNATPISNIYKHPKIESSLDFFFRNSRSSLSEYFFNKKQLIETGFKDFQLGWFSDKLAVLEVSNFNNIYTINQAIVKIRVSSISISGDKSLVAGKLNARFEYYYYLINYHIEKYNDSQIKILKKELNKCYINNKKRIDLYFRITRLYIKNNSLNDIMSLNKQIISFIFK